MIRVNKKDTSVFHVNFEHISPFEHVIAGCDEVIEELVLSESSLNRRT